MAAVSSLVVVAEEVAEHGGDLKRVVVILGEEHDANWETKVS